MAGKHISKLFFSQIFRGSGWPWIIKFDGFQHDHVFPTQHNLEIATDTSSPNMCTGIVPAGSAVINSVLAPLCYAWLATYCRVSALGDTASYFIVTSMCAQRSFTRRQVSCAVRDIAGRLGVLSSRGAIMYHAGPYCWHQPFGGPCTYIWRPKVRCHQSV